MAKPAACGRTNKVCAVCLAEVVPAVLPAAEAAGAVTHCLRIRREPSPIRTQGEKLPIAEQMLETPAPRAVKPCPRLPPVPAPRAAPMARVAQSLSLTSSSRTCSACPSPNLLPARRVEREVLVGAAAPVSRNRLPCLFPTGRASMYPSRLPCLFPTGRVSMYPRRLPCPPPAAMADRLPRRGLRPHPNPRPGPAAASAPAIRV